MHDEPGLDGHEHFDIDPTAEYEDIEGIEMFTLRSVGIDIGSSTTHLVFSHLTLRREGAALSSQYRVTDRKVLYRSSILLTPYIIGTQIDTDKVIDFIHSAYRDAGFTPQDIDTGAVVITGEALKKENAQPITEFFARDSGKFICASAGPNHEALLAAYGCGAVAISKNEDATVLNVDMGGGTSKLSLIRDGVVTRTAAVSVGARLIAFDESGVVVRVEEPAKLIMNSTGHSVELGQRLTEQERVGFAEKMATVLFEAITGELSPLARDLMVTEPNDERLDLQDVDYIVFSGGVSEYVYGRETVAYGDEGPLLAQCIRQRLASLPKKGMVREPTEGIRATVIGAGEYTIQASGTTSYISSTDSLPAFGLKVVHALMGKDDLVENAVKHALTKFDLDRFGPGLALALTLNIQPDYQSLRRVAEGISTMLEGTEDDPAPFFLVLDIDVAKSLGGILKEELLLKRDAIVVDGIDVGDLDFIDIGRPLGVSESLPVTVKSLMFPSSPH